MAVNLIRQPGQRRTIQKYGGGGFTVAGERFTGSILILPDGVKPWPISTFAEVTVASFEPLAPYTGQFDVCLLGCGARAEHVPAALRAALKGFGLHVEAMDTGAACRTFNVLAAEGRALAAALIAI